MKTVAIIQARMSSTRLPGKCCLPLAGKTALWYTVRRCLRSEEVDTVCVATTTNPVDDHIVNYVAEEFGGMDVACYRGSENDVLQRTIEAARFNEADIIVDVTSDCPMVDHTMITAMVNKFKTKSSLYISNVKPRTVPDGLDIQVYRADTLKRIMETVLVLEREHSGWNIARYAKRGERSLYYPKAIARRPDLRWTLDTPEDHQFLQRFMSWCVKDYGAFFTAEQAMWIHEVLA